MFLFRLYLFCQLVYFVSLARVQNRGSNDGVVFQDRHTAKLTKRDSYKIAMEKCSEYAKYRYVQKPSTGVLLSNGPPRKLTFGKMDCKNTEPLISGGAPALLKEFPHMALLGYGQTNNIRLVSWSCGGTLISDRYVLTAAHCYNSGPDRDLRWVRLGELIVDDTKDKAQPKDFSIAEKIPHPQYRVDSYYHDIMLVKLSETVKLSPYMRPICLWPFSNTSPLANKHAIITGWGQPQTGTWNSEILLKAKVQFYQDENCRKLYSTDKKLATGYSPNTMICAGDKISSNDTCQGDSGGPLQIPIPNSVCMMQQVGVISFGPAICGQKGKAGVYTKVSHYIPWIQSIVWP